MLKVVKQPKLLKYYFKPFDTRNGVEVCGLYFHIPFYVDLADSAVLEATIDSAWLSRPIGELIKHFETFDWKFYKTEDQEEKNVFIVSFIGL